MRQLITAAVIAALPLGVQAQDAQPDLRVMMCQLIDESGTGWVPDFLMFTRQNAGPHAGRIEVYDPVLQKLVRHPIKAVVTVDDAKGRTYGWALGRVRNNSGQRTERLDYRLRVSKSDGTAELLVTAQGYQNTMRGVGECATP